MLIVLYFIIDVYTEYGKKEIEEMSVFNRKAELTGEVIMKVNTIQIATYVATHILTLSMCMLTNTHTSMLIINFRQAPFTAGVYEARYYPYALNSNKTGKRHDVYWMKAKFTVIQA